MNWNEFHEFRLVNLCQLIVYFIMCPRKAAPNEICAMSLGYEG